MTENVALNPAPPNLPGLVWRPIGRDDLAALVDLARACLRADGGLPFLFEPDVVQGRFFPDTPGAGIGAFDLDQRLGACLTVHRYGDPSPQQVTLTGYVRPDLRRRGLGTYLMRWGQAQAQALFTEAASGQRLLRIATESLTEPAHRLYLAHGFASESEDEDWIMRRDLRSPLLPDHPLPQGMTFATWQPDVAEQFFQAYHAAFRGNPGFPNPSAEQWIDGVNGNDLVTEATLLVREGDQPLGFVIGALDLTGDPPGGFVAQIGVVPEARRRGVASALLVESLRRMQAAGAPYADLQVYADNPGAIQAYAGVGFVTFGRRARYERPAEQ